MLRAGTAVRDCTETGANLEYVKSSQYFTKDDVLPIQLGQRVQREEKLRSVRVFAGITCIQSVQQPQCVQLSQCATLGRSTQTGEGAICASHCIPMATNPRLVNFCLSPC